DPETGRQKFNARYGPAIRSYDATIAAVKLAPGDAHPALVMINPKIPGLRAVRLDGKTRAETLWKVVVGPLEDQYQPAVRITPGGSADLWRRGGVTPLPRPLPKEEDLTRTAGGSAPLWRETPGAPDFLLRFPDGVRSCRLTAAGVQPGRLVTTHAALGNAAPPDP